MQFFSVRRLKSLRIFTHSISHSTRTSLPWQSPRLLSNQLWVDYPCFLSHPHRQMLFLATIEAVSPTSSHAALAQLINWMFQSRQQLKIPVQIDPHHLSINSNSTSDCQTHSGHKGEHRLRLRTCPVESGSELKY